jgi:hypothetical protein
MPPEIQKFEIRVFPRISTIEDFFNMETLFLHICSNEQFTPSFSWNILLNITISWILHGFWGNKNYFFARKIYDSEIDSEGGGEIL